jgi:hypothetical protein
MDTKQILENVTNTLLYKGYSLFPYAQNSINNKKSNPVGIVYPEKYQVTNPYAQSLMRSECIMTGNQDAKVNIEVRFLHLIKQEVYNNEIEDEDFILFTEQACPGSIFSSSCRAIERKVTIPEQSIKELLKNGVSSSIKFSKIEKDIPAYNRDERLNGKQHDYSEEITGHIIVSTTKIASVPDTFKLIVIITNDSEVENAATVLKDEALFKSFLSTHIILNIDRGRFISQQNPSWQWEKIIKGCENQNAWSTLINKSDSTMLSSPIIICDYPEISSKSNLDPSNSTEIEESLLLQVGMLSNEEKNKIGKEEEKLSEMLNKVKSLIPD